MADSCWMPLNTSIKFSLRSLNYQMHCTIRCNTKSFQVRRAVFRSVYWQKYNIMIIIIIYVGLTSRWFLTHMNGRNITYWHLAGFCLTKWLEFWLHNVSLRDVCDAWTRNAASSRNVVDCGVKCRCQAANPKASLSIDLGMRLNNQQLLKHCFFLAGVLHLTSSSENLCSKLWQPDMVSWELRLNHHSKQIGARIGSTKHSNHSNNTAAWEKPTS